MKTYNYSKLLNTERERKSTVKRTSAIEEIYSDRSRILYCSSLRRLQQKAQVFSLEPNASIRTRLTHSLEVTDLGRTLASKVTSRLVDESLINREEAQTFIAIVENACLLHDIGNPPFGHFGECAIRDWAKKKMKDSIPPDLKSVVPYEKLDILLKDFYEFDGNPQGFRTITKLQTEHDEHSLNLTYATLACTLKYSRAAGEEKDEGILKKAGYFQSEKDLVERIHEKLGLQRHSRYPFTYIMEAADDIAYCMSDISDGIEKRILTEEEFLRAFAREWKSNYPYEELPVNVPKTDMKGFNRDVSIPWSKAAMDEACDNYFLHHKDVYDGTYGSLLSKDGKMGKVIDVVKQVSRRILYTSIEAESIELTGYAVISGILDKYSRLLKLPRKTFEQMTIDSSKATDVDIERRLYNRLGKHFVQAYQYAMEKHKSDYWSTMNTEEFEWWLRTHLIVDHVSGMTDEFALQTYQMLTGIELMRT